MADWSGRDYAEVSELQRAMITDAMAVLAFARDAWVLDIGCGDGFLSRAIAELVPAGGVVGADASPRMIWTANAVPGVGAHFVLADARRLPFTASFDAAVSFNALHWVPQQATALGQIASVLKPGGRATIHMVCAGARESLESVVMRICRAAPWAASFDGFTAPFIHPDPATYGELAAQAGLRSADITVTDHEWDFGSRAAFERWCGVGLTAWTDRLAPGERDRFIDQVVTAYEPVAGRSGLFRYMQMRTELVR